MASNLIYVLSSDIYDQSSPPFMQRNDAQCSTLIGWGKKNNTFYLLWVLILTHKNTSKTNALWIHCSSKLLVVNMAFQMFSDFWKSLFLKMFLEDSKKNLLLNTKAFKMVTR